MPYIPEAHLQYDLLPWSRKHGGEVFSYPGRLLEQITEFLPEGETLMPYGFDSYDEYYKLVDDFMREYATTLEAMALFRKFKKTMICMNQKESWSVLRYLGADYGDVGGLRRGHCYYWPCSKEHPVYEGVVDEEEFTSYWFPTEPSLWEILEDPTGMAHRTIYNKENYCSQEDFDHVMEQIKNMRIDP